MKMASENPSVLLDVGSIQVNGQSRRFFGKETMKQLTDSVRANGILSPLLVRPRKDGQVQNGFILIAGERRLRAAKEAGLKVIPVIVRDVDEKEAIKLQALENLQRENLSSIEEAHLFLAMINQSSLDIDQIRMEVDKTRGYVLRAVRLLELPPQVVELIEAGKLTAAHGHQLLRLADPKKQVEVARATIEQELTPTDLQESINRQLGRDLSKAQFPKDKPYADKIACAACPYNSGNQGDLFQGTAKGRCTNLECFDIKSNVFLKQYADAVAEKYPAVIFGGAFVGDHKEPQDSQRIWGNGLNKEMLALLKKDPKQITFIVHQSTYDPTPEVIWYVKNGAEQKKVMGYSGSSSSSGSRETSKQRFVRKFKTKYLLQVLLTAGEKALTKPMLEQIATRLDSYGFGVLHDLFLMEKNAGREAFKKLSGPKLQGFIACAALLDYRGDVYDAQLTKIGLDGKKHENIAKRNAETAWEAKHPAKKAKPAPKSKAKK